MAFDRARARRLTSDAEFALLEGTLGAALKDSSERRLRSDATRIRRLRDKHRDLLRRQRLATRERTGTKHGRAPNEANARTGQKARIFEDALGRIEARLAELARARRPVARKPKTAGAKGPKPPRARGAAPSKRGPAAKLQERPSARAKAIRAHVASRTRRAQARRDARR